MKFSIDWLRLKRWRVAFFIVAVLLLWILSAPILVLQDKVQSADAIVVIGGDHKPERMQKAAQLYEQGFAPVIIISAGTIVWEGDTQIAEAEVMRRQALAFGLPEQALILEAESRSTLENARYTYKITQANNYHSILLVTSAYHSRRAKQIFQDVYESSVTIWVQPATQEFCPPCWALDSNLMSISFYEYQNWLRYWTKIGFK